MAVTATISVSPSTVQVGQKVTASVTFTNGGGSAATVTGMQPYAIFTGAGVPMPSSVAYGVPNLQANNASISIAGSGGTAVIPFDLTFFAPSTGLLSAGAGTYDIGCQCQTSDGSVFHPAVATVTVNNITFASSQQ